MKRITTRPPIFSEFDRLYVDNVEVKYRIDDISAGNAINKLGQLEDIEDELGISLETYVRLHQDGFYGICEDDDHEKPYIYQFDNRCFNIFADDKTIVVYFEGSNEEYRTYRIKDYGKTWALTKEELL